MKEAPETCSFCQILNGSRPAFKVWESLKFLAFLDLRPINPGHRLVIPKQHVDSVFDLEEPLYSELFGVVKELSEPLRRATGASRVGVVIEGFGVPHAHIHLVPVNGGNELNPTRARAATDKELAVVASHIRHELGRHGP